MPEQATAKQASVGSRDLCFFCCGKGSIEVVKGVFWWFLSAF
jgi:hypothetical protein